MPTAQHETPVALAKQHPDLVAWLLANVFDLKVPDYHHTRLPTTEVRVLVPRTYHADGMVLFCDPNDHPLLAAVLEVQRSRDRAKRRTWKLYVAQLEAELDLDTALVVFCPDLGLARWYRRLFESDGPSLRLQPLIFTPGDVPLVVDLELARADPALAVLSAICHGAHANVDTMFPALLAAIQSEGPINEVLCYDIVLSGLPTAVRARWEAFMTATTQNPFYSDVLRAKWDESYAKGEAKGEAEGGVHAVLTVLDARGISVSDEIREQIEGCTDLAQLDTWLRRAVTASSAAEVVE